MTLYYSLCGIFKFVGQHGCLKSCFQLNRVRIKVLYHNIIRVIWEGINLNYLWVVFDYFD